MSKHFYFINFKYLPLYDGNGNHEADNEVEDYELNDNTDKTVDDNHEIYLFIWCILSGRIELAKTFWRHGRVCL